MPTLETDDGATIAQSLAILEWLEETHPAPPSLPRDTLTRGRVRAFALTVACDIHPLNNPRVLRSLARDMGQDQAAQDIWYATGSPRDWAHWKRSSPTSRDRSASIQDPAWPMSAWSRDSAARGGCVAPPNPIRGCCVPRPPRSRCLPSSMPRRSARPMPAERTDPLDGFDLRHLPTPFHIDHCPDRLGLAPELDRHLAFGLGVHQCARLSLGGRMAGSRSPTSPSTIRPTCRCAAGGRAAAASSPFP
ncbi:MAG: hypothetical protein ACREFY_20785 [Acetobacteraceae bacterium]